ncbi:MAG: hypothetical protein WD766_08820 [Gemmatimonadota bacterium]
MSRFILFFLSVLAISTLATPADAQEWRPSWRDMPSMPAMGELAGDWLGPRAAWFEGTSRISGVEPSALSAVGQVRSGSSQAQVVQFNSGPVPAVVWQDRNGDGQADIVEIYRAGGVIIQVIDAEYDGRANVLRIYDPSGSLTREEQL